MKFFQVLLAILVAALLSACGGGGGSPGTTAPNGQTGTNGQGGTVPTPTPTPTLSGSTEASRFELVLDKFVIKNSGSDEVGVTITALNDSGNPINGLSVGVKVNNATFTPDTDLITKSGGKVTGKVTIGALKSNRKINVLATVGSLTQTRVIDVIGSEISVTPVPAIPTPGQTVTLSIKAKDASGAGLARLPLEISGLPNYPDRIVLETDASGNASVAVVAPAVGGDYQLSTSGSGVVQITGLSVSGGGVVITRPVAVGPISTVTAILLPNPTSVPPNVIGSTANRAVLTAKFFRGNNSTVENMRVRFSLIGDVLGAGETISTGNEVVYSGLDGVATAAYIPGTRTSPTNGVKVRVCYDLVDFPVGSCPNLADASLTVQGQPIDISIGNFNKLESADGGLKYIERFLIQVADSSGNAVADADLSMSVDITHFGKGAFSDTFFIGNTVPNSSNLKYGDQVLGYSLVLPITSTRTFIAQTVTFSPDLDPFTLGVKVWCVNEDANKNGVNDVGEDINGNGLEPQKSEIVLSFPNGKKTRADGSLIVQVAYPQNMGSWLAYTLKATTDVVGTKGERQRSFITSVLEADLPNGSFRTPPFGNRSCRSPN
jgi:hypothetical protein